MKLILALLAAAYFLSDGQPVAPGTLTTQPSSGPGPEPEPAPDQPYGSPGPAPPTVEVEPNYSVLTFQSRDCRSEPLERHPFDLTGVFRKGSNIIARVRFPGNCEMHTFTLCIDPERKVDADGNAVLLLFHDSGGDTCTALQTEDLEFDDALGTLLSGESYVGIRVYEAHSTRGRQLVG